MDLNLKTVTGTSLIGPPDLTQAAKDAQSGKGDAVEKAARDFESVLLHRLFEEMRRTIPDSGLLESGTNDQVQGMFWMYMAQDVAAKGGIGMAKELTRQFRQMIHDSGQDPTPKIEAKL
ncbi:MAG: rod-binding protein [Planctomycetota bacterium]|nr:rod-binding protein [Planctomycetota bacterium]